MQIDAIWLITHPIIILKNRHPRKSWRKYLQIKIGFAYLTQKLPQFGKSPLKNWTRQLKKRTFR